MVNPHLFCGSCPHCLRGEHEICDHRPLISWDRPGGAAEYVAVRESNAYPVAAANAEQAGALRGGRPAVRLADELYARGGGNPFFTEQLVAAAASGPAGGGGAPDLPDCGSL